MSFQEEKESLARDASSIAPRPSASAIVPVSLAALALLVSLPAALLNQIPDSDCAARYAPMAEAFALCDWRYAFHPSIPPLFTALAGSIAWLSGLSGFMAAKLASALLFALGTLPLYGVFKLLFDRRVALLATALYVFCPPLIKLSGEGLRDPAKGLFLALAVYGAVSLSKGASWWKGAFACGFGMAGLALTRGDSLVIAFLCLALALFAELWPAFGRKSFAFPKASVLAGALFLALCAPWLAYEKGLTGYFAIEPRQVQALERLLLSPPASAGAPALASSQAGAGAAKEVQLPGFDDDAPKFGVSKYLSGLVKGFLPSYLLLALPALLLSLIKRRFSLGDSLVVTAIAGNAVLVTLQILLSSGYLYVSQRYIVVASPLFFGWTAATLLWAADGAVSWRRKLALPLKASLLCLLAILAVWGWTRVVPHGSRAVSKAAVNADIVSCAGWLKANKGLASVQSSRFWSLASYSSGLVPVMADVNPKVAGLAGLGYADLDDCKEPLASFCAERGVAFVVVRPQTKELGELLAKSEGFVFLKAMRPEGDGFAVWGFVRNLKPGFKVLE